MLYLGDTNYKNVNFSFAFDGKQLELVPQPGEEARAQMLEPGFRSDGIRHYSGKGVLIESEYLELMPSNAFDKLIVFPAASSFLPEPLIFRSLRVRVRAFILVDPSAPIVGLRFRSSQLSKLYNDKAALDMRSELETPQFTVSTKGPRSLVCNFNVRDKPIEATFFHIVKMTHKPGEPPLTVESALDFRFDADNDYSSIFNLAMIAQDFLKFCLQVSKTKFDAIEILVERPAGDCLREHAEEKPVASRGGSLVLCQQQAGYTEGPMYYIPIGTVKGFEDALFQKLADHELSLRHLPSPERVRIWDEARMILLAASFDQEVSLLYPNGIPHKEKTMEARSVIVDALRKTAIASKNKETRSLANQLIKITETNDSFSSRMAQIYKDHSRLINDIRSFPVSKKTFSEFAKRIQSLRNSLAHGALEVAYGDSVVDDALELEQIVLAIQMLRIGLKEEDAIRMVTAARKR